MLCTQPSHFEPESCSTLGPSMDRAAVVVVSSDEESSGERSRAAATPEPTRSRPAAAPEPPRAWRFQQWAPHEGWGLCRGLNGVCTLGENNQPANAGCDGLCDLCNVEDLPMLHRLGQGRLTHLLLQLSENKAEMVLARIRSMVDEDMAMDLRQRMARARRRKAADRPRRGRRGPYKSKSSGLEKKNKKEEQQGNAKKRRRSDSASSQTPEFGSLKKNKRDDAGHRHVKKSPRDQIAVSLQANFEEVDEGQRLTIDGVQHRNCCLPLAIARADAGLSATRTEVHKKAQEWIAGLPAYMEYAVPANEASPGEMLFEDYLNKVVQDDESIMVCLVVTHQKITRVWAGLQATLEMSRVLYMKHVPGHFTALAAKDASQPTETLLKSLPPIQEFSFVGNRDLKDEMCRAQQTAIEF